MRVGGKAGEQPDTWIAPSGWQDATLYGSQDGRHYRLTQRPWKLARPATIITNTDGVQLCATDNLQPLSRILSVYYRMSMSDMNEPLRAYAQDGSE